MTLNDDDAGEHTSASQELLSTAHQSYVHVKRKPLPASSTHWMGDATNSRVEKKTSMTSVTASSASYTPLSGTNLNTPIWLRRTVLITTSVLFTVLWVALLILWRFDGLRNGYGLSLTSNHLAWTYGPTAILVVFVSFWRQIDYSCKATQPWRVMAQGSDTADKTVLLDYLWPFSLTSLVDAIRNRHWLVVCSITGFITLKLVTLISTGLLVAIETPVTASATFQHLTAFNGSDFWKANPPTAGNESTSDGQGDYRLPALGSTYSKFSDDIYYDYLNTLNNSTPARLGFRKNFAVQSFLMEGIDDNVISKTVLVDTFVPNVTCEVANLTYLPVPINSTSVTQYSGFKLRSQSCPSYQGNENAPVNASAGVYRDMTWSSTIFEPTLGSDDYVDFPPQTLYSFWRVNCSADTESQFFDDDRQSILNRQTPLDFRIGIATLNMTFKPYVSGVYNGTTKYRYETILNNYDALVCKVGYTIQEANLTVIDNERYNFSFPSATASARHLDDLTELQLTEIVYDLYIRTGIIATSDFQPLLNILKATSTYYSNNPLDLYNKEQVFIKSLRGMAAAFMQKSFTSPATNVLNGTTIIAEQKLHVKPAIVFTMIAGLIIMSILALVIAFLTIDSNIPWSYDTVGGQAVVLASSKRLIDLLCSIGIVGRKEMSKRFQSIRFKTRSSYLVSIEVSDQRTVETEGPIKLSQLEPWKPLAMRSYMVCIMLLLPIASIVGLEVLHQLSEKNNGISTTTDQATVKTYATRYLSVALMFIIATIFNSLDFTFAVAAPFSRLALGQASTRKSLGMNLLGKMPPHALYRSIVLGQIGPTLSAVVSIIGSLLTIVVAGLWIVSHTSKVQDVKVSEVSSWSVDWNNSKTFDNGALATYDKIQHSMLSVPLSIWNDFVFPNLGSVMFDQSQGSSGTVNTTLSNFTITLPILRPALVCDIIPSQNIDVQSAAIPEYDVPVSLFNISAQVPLSRECIDQIQSVSNQTVLNFAYANQHTSNYTWYGVLVDLYVGNDTELDRNLPFDAFMQNPPGATNPPGCPSLGVFFGYMDETMPASQLVENATALVCYQKIQQLNASVTYVGQPSEQVLSLDNPPVPQESSSKYLEEPLTGADSFSPRVSYEFYLGTTWFDPHGIILDYDHFFNHVLFGPNATNIEDLLGVPNQQNLLKAVQRVYTAYMANVIDLSFRQLRNESSSSADEVTRQGTMQTAVYRLKIDNTSKLILQIMLAVMVVLGALAVLTVKINGILPKNPCSIARTMALLAQSSLVREEGVLSTIKGRDPPAQNLQQMLDGRTYSLGWWRTNSRSPVSSPIRELREAETNGDEETSHLNMADHTTMRFGVDIGTPEILGFKMKESWVDKLKGTTLRRRKRKTGS